MRALFTLIIFTIIISTAKGQEKKDLAIYASGGLLTSPNYQKSTTNGYFGVGFEYYLTKNHVLSANYLMAKNNYLAAGASTKVGYDKGTNATAFFNTFSILYQYKFLNTSQFSMLAGAGAGVTTRTLESFTDTETNTLATTIHKSFLVLPVSLDLNYRITNRWHAGVKSGFIIEPGASLVTALHAGPRLSFVLP